MPDVIGPVVGGFAIVQEAPPAIAIEPAGGAAWATGPTLGEIRVVHRIGPVDREPGRLLVDAPPPMGRCWVDAAGNLALSNDAPDGSGEQLLRTEVDGSRYVLTHEAASAARYFQWLWQRTIFGYAVASRGAGLLAHATGLRLRDGRTVLCPGISGTGKSTIARLMLEHAHGEVDVLSDDRTFVRRDGEGASLWGTPWHSSASALSPAGGPLAAIVLLHHGTGASLRALGASEATRLLLRTVALPFWSEGHLAGALGFLGDILRSTPVYELSYTPGPAAVGLLLDTFAAGSGVQGAA